jgi:hypothetical protein
MADQVKLKYHQATFSLLNEQPVTATVNRGKIERWEHTNGTRLPASVREWYSLKGSEDRLHSGRVENFGPLRLQKALNGLSKARQGGRASLANRLEIGYWDSGAVSYVRLDGSADPPVDGGWDDRVFSETFSAFAFVRAWSRKTSSEEFRHAYMWEDWVWYAQEADPNFPLLQADEPGFGRTEMAYLATRFTGGWHRLVRGRWREGIHPLTEEQLWFYVPVSVVRFFGPTARVQIVCQGDPSRRRTEAHWDISADSEAALVDVVSQHLWEYGTLAQSLRSPTQAGKAALRKLRRRRRNS